jgi:hypothetical protein
VEQPNSDLVRNVLPRGAEFFREGKKVMFRHQVDRSTVIGPREATADDIEAFPEAYADMREAPKGPGK